MAKSSRAPAQASNDSKSAKTTKSAARKPARTPDKKLSPKAAKAVSSSALLVEDEFYNLRASLLAFGCLQSFLSPHHRQAFEEFHIEPGELRSLVTVINADVERRMQAVGDAIASVRKALH